MWPSAFLLYTNSKRFTSPVSLSSGSMSRIVRVVGSCCHVSFFILLTLVPSFVLIDLTGSQVDGFNLFAPVFNVLCSVQSLSCHRRWRVFLLVPVPVFLRTTCVGPFDAFVESSDYSGISPLFGFVKTHVSLDCFLS